MAASQETPTQQQAPVDLTDPIEDFTSGDEAPSLKKKKKDEEKNEDETPAGHVAPVDDAPEEKEKGDKLEEEKEDEEQEEEEQEEGQEERSR